MKEGKEEGHLIWKLHFQVRLLVSDNRAALLDHYKCFQILLCSNRCAFQSILGTLMAWYPSIEEKAKFHVCIQNVNAIQYVIQFSCSTWCDLPCFANPSLAGSTNYTTIVHTRWQLHHTDTERRHCPIQKLGFTNLSSTSDQLFCLQNCRKQRKRQTDSSWPS